MENSLREAFRKRFIIPATRCITKDDPTGYAYLTLVKTPSVFDFSTIFWAKAGKGPVEYYVFQDDMNMRRLGSGDTGSPISMLISYISRNGKYSKYANAQGSTFLRYMRTYVPLATDPSLESILPKRTAAIKLPEWKEAEKQDLLRLVYDLTSGD